MPALLAAACGAVPVKPYFQPGIQPAISIVSRSLKMV